MKKLVALLLVVVLMMSMAVTASAVTGNVTDDKGSITVSNAHVGITYKLYQILVLKSFDTEQDAFVYEANDAWKDWIADADHGAKYLSVNTHGSYVWVTSADPAEFAKDAIAYAKANGIDPVASQKAAAPDGNAEATNVEIKFEDLELGYYLMDSSAGLLCSLDSTIPDINIREKNPIPPVDKKVFDADGNPQDSISAKVGQEVMFGTKITVHVGSHNYVYEDKMEAGLTFVENSVQVYPTPYKQNDPISAEYYDVVANPGDGLTFKVVFKDEFITSFDQTTDLTILYKAVVNENAEIHDGANVNEGRLKFGDDGETKWDPAEVRTYKFGIVKTNATNTVLEGAEFELYYDSVCTNQILLVEDKPTDKSAIDGVNYYRPATPDEIAAEGFESAVIKAGRACVWGVRDHVAMFLKETKAPEGYNPLTDPYQITALNKENNLPVFKETGEYDHGGVEIENQKGAMLPQTGGAGTTLFYVFGGLMVAGAAALLITKKRMASQK